jgi:hypothetical protein
MAVLAAGLAAGLSTPIQAQDTKFLPEETEVIMTVNFKQIMNSKLVQDNQILVGFLKQGLEAQLQKDPDAAAAFKELGIDPFNDLDKLTIGATGGKDLSKMVVVMTGKFSASKIASVMKKFADKEKDSVKIHGSGASAIYEFAGKGGANENGFMTVVGNKHVLVTQNKDTLKSAVAQGKAGGEPALKKEVQALLANLNNKQSIGFVATSAALQKGIKESNNQQAQQMGATLEKLKGMAASITISNEIAIQANLEAKDADTAKEIVKQATGGLVLANFALQQQAQQNPQIAPLVDVLKTLRVTSQGNGVTATGRVSADVIEKGLKMLKDLQPNP